MLVTLDNCCKPKHIVSALKELHQTKWPKEESYDIRDIVDGEIPCLVFDLRLKFSQPNIS